MRARIARALGAGRMLTVGIGDETAANPEEAWEKWGPSCRVPHRSPAPLSQGGPIDPSAEFRSVPRPSRPFLRFAAQVLEQERAPVRCVTLRCLLSCMLGAAAAAAAPPPRPLVLLLCGSRGVAGCALRCLLCSLHSRAATGGSEITAGAHARETPLYSRYQAAQCLVGAHQLTAYPTTQPWTPL